MMTVTSLEHPSRRRGRRHVGDTPVVQLAAAYSSDALMRGNKLDMKDRIQKLVDSGSDVFLIHVPYAHSKIGVIVRFPPFHSRRQLPRISLQEEGAAGNGGSDAEIAFLPILPSLLRYDPDDSESLTRILIELREKYAESQRSVLESSATVSDDVKEVFRDLYNSFGSNLDLLRDGLTVKWKIVIQMSIPGSTDAVQRLGFAKLWGKIDSLSGNVTGISMEMCFELKSFFGHGTQQMKLPPRQHRPLPDYAAFVADSLQKSVFCYSLVKSGENGS